MSGSRLAALSYLAWRALLAHPLKRLRHQGSGLERFRAAYESEGLPPSRPEDREAAEAASACIGCGLCETACPLERASPAVRSLGLAAVFRLYSKSTADLPHAREALEACAACTGCEPLCPTGVPIGRIVAHLRRRLGERR